MSYLCLSNIRLLWALRQFSVKSPSNSLPISHLVQCMAGHQLQNWFVISLCLIGVQSDSENAVYKPINLTPWHYAKISYKYCSSQFRQLYHTGI